MELCVFFIKKLYLIFTEQVKLCADVHSLIFSVMPVLFFFIFILFFRDESLGR